MTRALAIFGGVQVAIILCQIARAKMIAVWIGPVGVGLFALYNQAYDTLAALFQLGLRQSSVRDIAAAAGTSAIQSICRAVRRWGWLLGAVAAVFTTVASPWLSELTFDDTAHSWAFVVIALLLLLASLTAARLAILQGMSRIKALAHASMWGTVIGVAVAAPMFYFWGLRSIIPAMAVFVTANWIAAEWQGRKNKLISDTPRPSWRSSLRQGGSFIRLGIYMTISGLLTAISVWAFTLWLNHNAGTHEVGLYQAGYNLVGAYVGLIFTAISMEYYPRLAAAASHPRRSAVLVSHEMSVALWVLMPVICAFIAADTLMVHILYSSDFVAVVPYLTVGIVGVTFRAVSWCMAFEILARGDGRFYILTEGLSAVAYVVLNIIGYRVGGLLGLGVAYIIWYAFYALIVWLVYRYRYGMRLGRGITALILLALLISAVAVAAKAYVGWWLPTLLCLWLLPLSYRRLRL